MCVFVDGALVESARLRLPRVESAAYVTLGAALESPCTDWPRPCGALAGQLGCVHLLEDAVSAEQVNAGLGSGVGFGVQGC